MTGIGYGKVILFGEHFVVYGMPALVSGLKDIKTVVEIEEGPWNKDLDERAVKALSKITETLNITKTFTLHFKEKVPVKQNLGSSAALCVAFTRALNKKYNLGLDDEKINEIAYKGEVTFHGTPSGIDNSASTFGKPLIFKKLSNGFDVKPLNVKEPLHLLIVNTGEKTKGTLELVREFREIKEAFSISKEAFDMYSALFNDALKCIEQGNIEELGFLMNMNHALLSMFKLSTLNIERARHIMFEHACLGAKITGAGGGGNIIGLFASKEKALNAKLALDKFGFKSFYSCIS